MHAEKKYLSDSYQVSFQATVLSCKPLPNGRYGVVLDNTFFYPESGGQVSDTGMIGDVDVVHVAEDTEGVVTHELTNDVPVGEAACRIDWDKRFDHMQQHTGQHILSRAFIKICGADTVGFHMGEETCTIDLDINHLGEKDILAAENLTNTIIFENRDIGVSVVTRADVKALDVRKSLPDGAESVRLVTIEDFDTCPCCGTHVKAAGEIGLVKVLKIEKVKTFTRVYFKAGIRALRDYQAKHAIVSSLSSRFTTSPEKVVEKMEKLAAEHRDTRRIIKKANEKLIVADRAQLLGSAMEYKGYRFIVHLLEAVDADYLRMLAAAFKSEDKIVVVLGSDTGCIVCNASGDVPIELSSYLTDAAKRAGGTGGGKGSFANVSVPPSINMTGFLEEVFNDIKNSI